MRGCDGPASPTWLISNGGGDGSLLQWPCGMQRAVLIRWSSPPPSSRSGIGSLAPAMGGCWLPRSAAGVLRLAQGGGLGISFVSVGQPPWPSHGTWSCPRWRRGPLARAHLKESSPIPPHSPVSRWSTLSQRKTWFLQTVKGWAPSRHPARPPEDAPGTVADEAAARLGVPVAGEGDNGGATRARGRVAQRDPSLSILMWTPRTTVEHLAYRRSWRLRNGNHRPQPGATQRQAFQIH